MFFATILFGATPIAPEIVGTYPYPVIFQHVQSNEKLLVELKTLKHPPAPPEKRFTGPFSFESLKHYPNKRAAAYRTIRSMEDLKGLARIKDKLGALEFCRLRTSPWTFNLFDETGVVMLEVMSTDMQAKLWAYGLGSVETFRIRANGARGVVSNEMFKREGLKGPLVETAPQGFRVKRTVIILNLKPWRSVAFTGRRTWGSDKSRMSMAEITEEVTQEGRYSMIEKQYLPSLLPVAWSFQSEQDFRANPLADY